MTEDPLEDNHAGRSEGLFALGLFHFIERLLLVVIVAMTLLAVIVEILAIYRLGTILLADILLMFLYLEVIGMVAVYYARRNSVFVYPIFIAITAVGRLVVLQGKEMAPADRGGRNSPTGAFRARDHLDDQQAGCTMMLLRDHVADMCLVPLGHPLAEKNCFR